MNLRPATGQELEEWDEMVAASPQGSLFHRRAWLEAAAQQSGTELVPLVACSGGQINCLLPVFLKKLSKLTVLFSPPRGCSIPSLGPVMLVSQTRQRSIEAIGVRVVEALAAYVGEVGASYVRIETHPAFQDIRPFLWEGYKATPRYTYVINLCSGAEAVFANFEKQVRTDARRATRYDDIKVIDGDRDTYRTLCTMVRTRYDEQDLIWLPSELYLESLYDMLGGEHIRTKAVVRGEEVLAGLVLLADGRRARHWLGGLKYDADYIGLNEWLHWEAIKTFAEEGYVEYELLGANTPHLCRHKSKYNPDPEVYFSLERMTLAGRAFQAASSLHFAKRIFRVISR